MLAERFACTEMIARQVQPVNMENFMSLFTLDVIKCCKANIEKRLCMFQGVRFAAGPLLVWAAWSCVQCDQTGRGFHIVSASIWHMVVPGHSVLMPVCCVSILALETQLDCVGTICLSVSQDPLKGIIDGHKLHVTLLRWVIRILLVFCEFRRSASAFLFSPCSCAFLCPPSSCGLYLPTHPLSDVEALWEPFWPVLWKWWRRDCSLLPSRSTSLKSSSALWMEPVWPVWPHLVLYIVSSKIFGNMNFTLWKK